MPAVTPLAPDLGGPFVLNAFLIVTAASAIASANVSFRGFLELSRNAGTSGGYPCYCECYN